MARYWSLVLTKFTYIILDGVISMTNTFRLTLPEYKYNGNQIIPFFLTIELMLTTRLVDG
jgi:hypothetical protein